MGHGPTQNFGWVGHKKPTMHLVAPTTGLYVQGRIKTKLGLMLLPGKGPIIFLALRTDQEVTVQVSRTLACDAATLY